MKEFIWDSEGINYVRSNSIRNFSITSYKSDTCAPFKNPILYKVIAWFSDTESMPIGSFDTAEQAHKFIDNLVKE